LRLKVLCGVFVASSLIVIVPRTSYTSTYRFRHLTTTAMSTRGTPPQAAPDFTHTAESIISATKKLIERSKKLEDSIAKEIIPQTATFGNVLQPLANDEADMSLESHILGFYQYVSSDKELRDASSEAEKLMDEYGIESSMRQAIYDLHHATSDTPAPKPEVPEAAYYLKKAHQSYIKNGMSLPADKRVRFKEIKKELSLLGRVVVLEVGLDGFVLLVEESEIRNEVLHNVHVRKRVNLAILRAIAVDSAQAGECVLSVNVHGARSANALSAAPSEGQGRINLVLNLDQSVQNHWTGLVQVNCVGLQSRLFCRFIRIPAVDLELLQ